MIWIILSLVARTSFLTWWSKFLAGQNCSIDKKKHQSYRVETEQCRCPWWMKRWNTGPLARWRARTYPHLLPHHGLLGPSAKVSMCWVPPLQPRHQAIIKSIYSIMPFPESTYSELSQNTSPSSSFQLLRSSARCWQDTMVTWYLLC